MGVAMILGSSSSVNMIGQTIFGGSLDYISRISFAISCYHVLSLAIIYYHLPSSTIIYYDHDCYISVAIFVYHY